MRQGVKHVVQSSPSDRRQDLRVSLELHCKLEIAEIELAAMITDLSLGGAGITLAFPIPRFTGSQVRSVNIDQIGRLKVVHRWRTSNRIGVAFESQATARPRIRDFFDANGIDIGEGARP